MRVVFVDIDGTICHTLNNSSDYNLSVPRVYMIEKINALYDNGDKIIYWTARGGNSGKDWTELTKRQLNEWGAKHHELRMDKPPYDVFYDDKAARIEDL